MPVSASKSSAKHLVARLATPKVYGAQQRRRLLFRHLPELCREQVAAAGQATAGVAWPRTYWKKQGKTMKKPSKSMKNNEKEHEKP